MKSPRFWGLAFTQDKEYLLAGKFHIDHWRPWRALQAKAGDMSWPNMGIWSPRIFIGLSADNDGFFGWFFGPNMLHDCTEIRFPNGQHSERMSSNHAFYLLRGCNSWDSLKAAKSLCKSYTTFPCFCNRLCLRPQTLRDLIMMIVLKLGNDFHGFFFWAGVYCKQSLVATLTIPGGSMC